MDLPGSDIASAAKEFVFDVSPAFVANHSVRSYLFARELAAVNGFRSDVDYDENALAVKVRREMEAAFGRPNEAGDPSPG